MAKTLHLIAACSENRVIGRAGRLPWRIPEDFAFLQSQTAGQTVILGRICFQTWPAAKAQGRHPIVVTRDRTLADDTVLFAASFSDALCIAENLAGDLYICGGQRIYEEAMLLAAAEGRSVRLHLTLVHTVIEGDRYFPEWRHLSWREISSRESADEHYRYTFLELARG